MVFGKQMSVAAPRFGQNVDVTIAVHVNSDGLMGSFAFSDDVFAPLVVATIFPNEPNVYSFGQRTSARKEINVAVIVKVGHA